MTFFTTPNNTSSYDYSALGGFPSNSPQRNTGVMPVGGGFNSSGGMGGGAGAGLDWNIGTGQLALGGLSALSSLWNGYQAQQLAQKSFNFQRDFAQRGMANQISNYNTLLEDKARSRAVAEGQTEEERAAYVERNRLR